MKLNGSKLRCFRKSDGYWSDPFQEYDFWSRTLSNATDQKEWIEVQDQTEMIEAIKRNKDVKFKDQDLSEISREILKEAKIEIDDVQDKQ